jgi:hypothetical protein
VGRLLSEGEWWRWPWGVSDNEMPDQAVAFEGGVEGEVTSASEGLEKKVDFGLTVLVGFSYARHPFAISGR